jgi:hypothetical protein
MRAYCFALIVGLLGAASVKAQLPAPDAPTLPPQYSGPAEKPTPTADGQPPPPPVFPSSSIDGEASASPGQPPDSVERPPSLPMQEATVDPYLIWARADFLLWWIKNGPAPPPLVTTGPSSAVSPGVLGQPGTAILIGGQPIDYGTFSGGRFSVGGWCNVHQSLGLEVTGFVLQKRSVFSTATSDASGTPVLARPFIDAQTNTQFVAFATFPDRFSGGVAVATSDRLWGLEANVLHNEILKSVTLRGDRPWADVRVDWFAGFRYLDLRENLTIFQSSQILAGGVASFLGNTVGTPNLENLTDAFGTKNFFWGGQIGSRWQLCHGAWLLDLLGKLALGGTQQVIEIGGTTTLVGPAAVGGSQTAAGGLLTTSTNIGRFTRDRFSVIPELGIQLGYQLCPEARVFVGYSLIYWTDAVRPSQQIDPVVNLTQVPIHPSFGPLVGPAQPAVPFRETDFWAQGINFGLELRY